MSARAPPVNVLEPTTFRAGRYVLDAEEMRFVSLISEDLGQMALAIVQVILETRVSESNHTIGMGITSGPEGSARWTALRRSAIVVLKAQPVRRKGVQARRPHVGHPVTPHVLTQIMGDHTYDVEMLIGL